MLTPFWQTKQHILKEKCQNQYFKLRQKIKARVNVMEYKSKYYTFLCAHKNMKLPVWR